jgi:hypothetical protein
LATQENQAVRRSAALRCTKVAQASDRLHHDGAFSGAFFDFGREARLAQRLILVQGCLFMD